MADDYALEEPPSKHCILENSINVHAQCANVEIRNFQVIEHWTKEKSHNFELHSLFETRGLYTGAHVLSLELVFRTL